MFTGFACLLDLTFLSWGDVIEGGDASVGDDGADGDPGGDQALQGEDQPAAVG